VDLESNPTKLIEVVEIGKQLLMTRGALTTFSIANDVAKYFAILPAMFGLLYAPHPGGLGRIVDNLLSMTRIESGRFTIAPVWCDVDEMISSAQQQVSDLISRHRMRILIPNDLPSVKVESGFMEQALANLTANAALYTEPGSEITISAQVDEAHLVLKVSDQGPGLPQGGENRIFEKFYRGTKAPSGGDRTGFVHCPRPDDRTERHRIRRE